MPRASSRCSSSRNATASRSAAARESSSPVRRPFSRRDVRSPRSSNRFSRSCAGGRRLYETLRTMHDVGTLGALVPEFGQLRSMVIRDFYHIYTVDEHTLRGIMELEHLGAGEHRQSCSAAHAGDARDRPPGGALPGDAAARRRQGARRRPFRPRRAARRARRAALAASTTTTWSQVERLVRHHLLMSHVAQHRDLQDDRAGRRLRAARRQRRDSQEALRHDLRRHACRRPRRCGTTGATCCSASSTCGPSSTSKRASSPRRRAGRGSSA